jgi:hypothetical protein
MAMIEAPDFARAVLFTNDRAVIAREEAAGHTWSPDSDDDGGVVFIDEGDVIANEQPAQRPTTRAGRGRRNARAKRPETGAAGPTAGAADAGAAGEAALGGWI